MWNCSCLIAFFVKAKKSKAIKEKINRIRKRYIRAPFIRFKFDNILLLDISQIATYTISDNQLKEELAGLIVEAKLS